MNNLRRSALKENNICIYITRKQTNILFSLPFIVVCIKKKVDKCCLFLILRIQKLETFKIKEKAMRKNTEILRRKFINTSIFIIEKKGAADILDTKQNLKGWRASKDMTVVELENGIVGI